MTENMKKFLEAVSKNGELAAKVSTLTKEDLLALAKELGIDLTEDDFAQKSELNDDDLEAVAGGWTDCFCIAGGGGKADEDGKACACVAFGGGQAKDGQNRCLCIGAGSGDKPVYTD
ncbi:MAG: Nif11-like leader peptide family natural product precursor [Clostridiales bacterium]|nr:Nif11-like leader peptide family natural product precursor [Clostridiales bacterium]